MRFRIPGNHQGPTHDLSLLIQRIAELQRLQNTLSEHVEGLYASGVPGLPGDDASAAIGVMGDRTINRSWQTPLFIPSGRFFHIILRCPTPNAATASQVIQGMANVSGYFM